MFLDIEFDYNFSYETEQGHPQVETKWYVTFSHNIIIT